MIKDTYFYHDIPLVIPDKHDPSKNSYTIFIGNNGIGKSRLLDALSRSLIEEKIPNQPNEYGHIIKDHYSSIEVHNYSAPTPSELKVFYSQNNLQNFLNDALIVPTYKIDDSGHSPKVIAVSTSPFDSFKLPINRNSERRNTYSSNYRYIGMRGSSTYSSASISLINSASSGLLEKLGRKENFERLAKVFEVLEFDPSLEFAFKPTYTNLDPLDTSDHYVFKQQRNILSYFDQNYNELTLDNTLGVQLDSKSRIALREVPSDILQEIKISLKTINNYFTNKSHFKLKAVYHHQWRYHFDGEFENNFLILNSIQTLLKYDLIKLMDLRLSKPSNREISLRRASSGEQCMLVIMLGIAGHITDNSSIFIDEPEISLHPKWQEKFMSLLIEVFSTYSGCKFYIATHSPQIISKLSEENCFITSLAKKDIYHAKDYKNRSADFQLAELFEAPGSMNEYLIRMAFGLISRIKATRKVSSDDIQEIKKLQGLAEKLEQDDPLLELIKTVFEMNKYYASNN